MSDPTLEPRIPEDDDPDLRPKETRQAVFLELLAEGSNLSEACRVIGINRSTAFRWRQSEPEFAAQCRTAFRASVDMLKAEAERRAIKGSDKLLMFLLERYAPDQFNLTQKVDVSGQLAMANAIVAARRRITKPDDDCPLV